MKDLPLFKATHKQFKIDESKCQYKLKNGVKHAAKCHGVDTHEGRTWLSH